MGISSPVIGDTTYFVGSLSEAILSSGLFQFFTILIGCSCSSKGGIFISFFFSSPFSSILAALIPSSTSFTSSSSISISTTFPGSTLSSSSAIAETLLLLITSSIVIGAGNSSSSSSTKSIVSTTTKSCQSIMAICKRSCSISSSAFCLACSCDRSHSNRCKQRSSTVVISVTLVLNFSVNRLNPFGGINTFEYASAREVKNMNILWVGFKKWNCWLFDSLLVSPAKKDFPLRATNCAVNLIISNSSPVIPSGSLTVYSSASGGSRTLRTGLNWAEGSGFVIVSSPSVTGAEGMDSGKDGSAGSEEGWF
ncbi:hypothetical protein RHGRI_007227 [Rhododendron griersonianum]|uniref:Uncharacterized protein n=1 Tax=Rhododendron griersonianum TaxID=479676 RepID=A0AAV6KXT0_9ERIC|nr:hypothetical protein RHGRI_007227 [Rhododendron griersonianum]